jgi:hypothetical protein
MDFENVSFWTRMFILPLSCMSAAMGHQIGKSVGIVEDVETEDDGVGWGTYLRVKIRLDIAKPLPRGRVLKINGSDTWVAFQYERLPKFCYHCGVIKHGVAGCLSRKGGIYHGDSSTQQFGCFLRVPPYNRSFPGKGGYGRSVYSGDSANSAGNAEGKSVPLLMEEEAYVQQNQSSAAFSLVRGGVGFSEKHT